MTYEDYVYFMLSEEDRGNEHSLRYWFACVDLDGDGRIGHMEMRLFYDRQVSEMIRHNGMKTITQISETSAGGWLECPCWCAPGSPYLHQSGRFLEYVSLVLNIYQAMHVSVCLLAC